MALIRWQPFQEMNSLQRDMNRMFEAIASMEQSSMQQTFMPLAEMEETEDAIYLKIEVPGMNADDLDVRVTKEAVAIAGERKIKSKSQNGMTRSEFRYGKFSRTLPLATRIDNNNVKGDYKDGILSLELPKVKEEHRVVKVSLGSNNNNIATQPQTNSNPQNKELEIDGSAAKGGYGNVADI